MRHSLDSPEGYRIKAVATFTGLSPHVIRKWEERYQFVIPYRSENGYRLYFEDDIQFLMYLNAQIEAGAQVVQLFDTWAGLLSREDYREWVLPAHREIVAGVNRAAAPLILYVNNGAHVLDMVAEAGADVMSLDWRADLGDAARRFGARISLQGNLDPCALSAPRERIFEMVHGLREAGRPARGHGLNLGHGCLPDTPVEGVRAFTDAARALGD